MPNVAEPSACDMYMSSTDGSEERGGPHWNLWLPVASLYGQRHAQMNMKAGRGRHTHKRTEKEKIPNEVAWQLNATDVDCLVPALIIYNMAGVRECVADMATLAAHKSMQLAFGVIVFYFPFFFAPPPQFWCWLGFAFRSETGPIVVHIDWHLCE